MLVLSRKSGESIVIGNDITVKVLEVRGDRVKLGFSAPADVAIHRAEVRQRVEEESPSPVCGNLPLDIEITLSCGELQGAAV